MTAEFSARTRAANLVRMRRETFDVLIVGGGIVGAGVARDAACRGLRTALVERGDFASGTSGKTSRLVHGGLRYLRNYRIRLVWQAVRAEVEELVGIDLGHGRGVSAPDVVGLDLQAGDRVGMGAL